MPKTEIPFSAFLEAVGPMHEEYVNTLHQYMTEQGYKTEIKNAANGYVLSYIHKPSKRTVLNYVFRKKGPLMRVYADNVPSYMEILKDWPGSMKAAVKKAGSCKRMLNPQDCNARCVMGFDFVLDDERQQKCRYGGFLFFLNEETKPYLREMVEHEVQVRG